VVHVHRITVDLLWLVAGTYIALVVLREVSLLTKDKAPSVSRAVEFAIGTGGTGAGSGG